MALFGRHKEIPKQTDDPVAGENNFVAVARIKDVRVGQILEVKAGEYKICLTKVGADCFAFDAFCPHQGWMLWAGEMHGETIRCDKHRWLFNVRTGQTLAPSDMPVCLPTFPLRLQDEHILVDMSEVRAVNLARQNKNKKNYS